MGMSADDFGECESDKSSSSWNQEFEKEQEEEEEEDDEEEEMYEEDEEVDMGTDRKLKWEVESILACLTGNEEKDRSMQWQCPICRKTTEWFTIHALIHHANDIPRRPKIHRRFGHILHVALQLRKHFANQSKGKEEPMNEKCHLFNRHKHDKVVWPPCIILRNVHREREMTDNKWVGMSTDELLRYFEDYRPVRVKHSSDGSGHRGVSLLIFSPSCVGYLNAQRMEGHFEHSNHGKDDWFSKQKFGNKGDWFSKQNIGSDMYGYYPDANDMNEFKAKELAWEWRHLEEAVYKPLQLLGAYDEELLRSKPSDPDFARNKQNKELKLIIDKLHGSQAEFYELLRQLRTLLV